MIGCRSLSHAARRFPTEVGSSAIAKTNQKLRIKIEKIMYSETNLQLFNYHLKLAVCSFYVKILQRTYQEMIQRKIANVVVY